MVHSGTWSLDEVRGDDDRTPLSLVTAGFEMGGAVKNSLFWEQKQPTL